MTEELSEQIAENRARAEMYRLLASVFFRELDESQIATLKAAPLAAPEEGRMKRGSDAVYRAFRLAAPDVLTRLRVDYARIFLAAGVYEGDTAVPFESVFTGEEGILMDEAREQVVAIFRAEEVTVDPELQSPEDHLSFELEFMAILSDRIAEAWEREDEAEARRLMGVQASFAQDHLLNWMPDLAERVVSFAKEPFYPAFMDYAIGFVEDDESWLEDSLAQ